MKIKNMLGVVLLFLTLAIGMPVNGASADEVMFDEQKYVLTEPEQIGSWWMNTYVLPGKTKFNSPIKIEISYRSSSPSDIKWNIEGTYKQNTSNGKMCGTLGDGQNGIIHCKDTSSFWIKRYTPNAIVYFVYIDRTANFDKKDKAGDFEGWVGQMLVWNIPPVVTK